MRVPMTRRETWPIVGFGGPGNGPQRRSLTAQIPQNIPSALIYHEATESLQQAPNKPLNDWMHALITYSPLKDSKRVTMMRRAISARPHQHVGEQEGGHAADDAVGNG